MISTLQYKDFRDICLRLKYYPEYFIVNIFCKNIKEKEDFIWLINQITNLDIPYGIWQYKNNNVLFKFFTIADIGSCQFIGARGNINIFSYEYSYGIVCEIILPMTNILPCQTAYAYQNTIELINEHERYEVRIKK